MTGLVADGQGYIPASDDKPVMPAFHVNPDEDLYRFFEHLKERGVKMLDENVRWFSDEAKVFLLEETQRDMYWSLSRGASEN